MAAVDYSRGGLGEPAAFGEAVTPHDSNELTAVTRGLWVGTGGDVKVVLFGGQTITFPNVQDGTLLPIRVRQVFSTGTDADDIVGLY